MFNKMKLALLVILVAQVFTIRLEGSVTVQQITPVNRSTAQNKDVIYYYTTTPAPYMYYCRYVNIWCFDPNFTVLTAVDYVDYVDYYRKDSQTGSGKKDDPTTGTVGKDDKFDVEKAKKEITALKKEIWGQENFSTEEIRNNNKAYDVRWLLGQLRIAKVLALEDAIKATQKKLRTELQTEASTELQTEATTELEGARKKKKQEEEEELVKTVGKTNKNEDKANKDKTKDKVKDQTKDESDKADKAKDKVEKSAEKADKAKEEVEKNEKKKDEKNKDENKKDEKKKDENKKDEKKKDEKKDDA